MKFIKIHTATLIPNRDLGFDVYIKLPHKELKYLRAQDSVGEDDLAKLKEKKVHDLYIPEEMLELYKKYLEEGLALLKSGNLNVLEKSKLLIGQSKAATEEMFRNPEKKENYTRTQEVVGAQVDHLIKNPEAMEQVLKLESFDKSIYQHSVNVSTIAVGLAHFLGATEEICQVVGTGARLHDIGKTQLDIEEQDSSKKLTKAQEEKMREHPREGCAILGGKKYISKDVLDIILLHEERIDGKGYPAGIRKMDQIFQVVGLANFYDKMVSREGKSPKEAYEALVKFDVKPYAEDLIIGLKDVLEKNKIF